MQGLGQDSPYEEGPKKWRAGVDSLGTVSRVTPTSRVQSYSGTGASQASQFPGFGEASLLLLGTLPSRFIPTAMVRTPLS